MTRLQSLAFERIEKLSKEAYECVPKKFRVPVEDEMAVSTETLKDIGDMLYEQQLWIDALNREEHS